MFSILAYKLYLAKISTRFLFSAKSAGFAVTMLVDAISPISCDKSREWLQHTHVYIHTIEAHTRAENASIIERWRRLYAAPNWRGGTGRWRRMKVTLSPGRPTFSYTHA